MLPAARPPSTDAHDLLSVRAVPDLLGRVVVEVVGDVDSFTAPLLAACLHSQTGRPEHGELVVDLEGVTLLGAAGVAVLAEADQECRDRGGRLVVRGGSPPVLRALRHAGLIDVLPLDGPVPRAAAVRSPRTPVPPRPRPRRAPARRPHPLFR